MRFGLFCTVQQPQGEDLGKRLEQTLEQVRLARDCGFASVVVSQHHLPEPYQQLQTVPLLARLAADSGSMRLVTGIILLAMHNPVDIAEQVATLDVISGGRVVFGVGLGYRDVEFEAFGVPRGERVKRFVEHLDVVLRLWGGEAVTYEGPHCRLREARLTLRCAQRPHPPVWIGANNEKAVARIGRLGHLFYLNPHSEVAFLEGLVRVYHDALRAAGHPIPAALPMRREFYGAADDATALAEARPFLEEKYRTYADWGQAEAIGEGQSFRIPFEELARDRFIVGGPERCTEEIARCRDRLGADHLILRIALPGVPHARVLRAIELVGSRIIPRFR
jgi:alkanesulfonate monooxygenase SsuD/methylene tetrahydromethanopterin reductase-like flavin-dependent oxidoreductase (luciferase family)